jgi:hypothetical protein
MLRKRWVRRTAIGLVVGFILVVAGLAYHRYSTRQSGLRRLAAAASHLDSTDPGWRLGDLDRARGTLPEHQNSALLVPRFKAALAGTEFTVNRPGSDRRGIFLDIPPNRRLDDEAADALDRALDGNDAALAIARSFRDYPRGLRQYAYSPDFIGTLTPGLQESRSVAALLDAAAERSCRDGRPGAALELVLAMLGLSRSIDREPFLIAALVRIASEAMAVRRLERILALTTPKGSLADLQAALLAESEADVFWAAVRGERAGMDMFFTNLRTGRLPPGVRTALAGTPGTPPPKGLARLRDLARAQHLPGDHAAYLEAMTRAHEVRNLPEPQQRAALRDITIPTHDATTDLTRLLLPSLSNLHDASLRTRAQLRCAYVGVALERLSRETGRWPDSLAEVPRDLLPAIPLDPFDGQPLRLARTADGIVVYSIGTDEQDDGGKIIDGSKASDPGQDVGFRLYNPAARGLPPLPRPHTPTYPQADRQFPAMEEPGRDTPTATLPYPREVPDR